MSDAFLRDVLAGLSASPKTLPPKHFYDAEGSRLFEAITRLPEYYPTRTETALLRRVAPELAAAIPPGATLVEFGSGSSLKTRILLDAALQLAVYAPIDISQTALAQAAEALRQDYPRLTVTPVLGDFTTPGPLPSEIGSGARIGFFPGSTIGNLTPPEAEAFLTSARETLGEGALFLIGIDLVKDPAVLVAAYDDAQGVTAAFNKNLLHRMRRELDAVVNPDAFDHRAVWNSAASRMEMHLVARTRQAIEVAGRQFVFQAGESLHTENSCKFTLEGFRRLSRAAGWRTRAEWTAEPPYALVLLRA